MGLDPRYTIPDNVINGSGMVWANCGATQFHLVYGEEAQVVPGSIGLWYDDLDGLKERLGRYGELLLKEGDEQQRPFETYSIDVDVRSKQESIRIVDRYGNVFYCRQQSSSVDDDPEELIRAVRQPTLTSTDRLTSQAYQSSDILRRFAMDDDQPDTNCRGIQYVEFHVPPNTAAQIAEFYDCVFDAPTNLLTVPSTNNEEDDSSSSSETNVAIVGIGSINPTTGRTSQSLLFRETALPLPPYDGHHISLYVGDDTADFSAAFKSCMDAGVVWVNPRYEDRVTNLNTAKKWSQFRFKDILDLQSGRKVFELEHEVRSVEHRGWTGLVGR